MAVVGVPWGIGQPGAVVPVSVARAVAYIATAGGDGVGASTDMKVQALAVPGNKVRIAPGTFAARIRSAGFDGQSFVALNGTETETDVVTPTTSAGGRSDLIVAVVGDPTVPGTNGSVPGDVANGPYWQLARIPGVPNTTKRLQQLSGYENRTGITLARIDIPASTATITAGMIVDLRKLAKARSERYLFGSNPTWDQSPSTNAGAWSQWPSYAPSVDIPEWATHVQLIGRVEGAMVDRDTVGEFRVNLGSEIVGGTRPYDFNETGWARADLGSITVATVPSALRGASRQLNMQARRTADAGNLVTKAYTQVIYDVAFEERPA